MNIKDRLAEAKPALDYAAKVRARDQQAAARAMLAALKHARDEIHNPGAFNGRCQGLVTIDDVIAAAIAAAEAAGIAEE